MATGAFEFSLDSLDFSVEGMTPAPATGRLVHEGETRFLVLRPTSRGVVPVRKCRTREQAELVAIPGDAITEVAA